MITIQCLTSWQQIRRDIDTQLAIGFVPTMGCLHQGHLSLIERSRQENAVTVVSIFVNPTQFTNQTDYQHYPLTLEQDCRLLEKLNVNYLLLPDKKAIYPQGNSIYLNIVDELATILEGQYRPGHLNGVLTVVMKLLLLVRPQRLYLGEKDYQQYRLIDKMVTSYFIPTQVVMCPTVRTPCGLAYSSRNNRLSESEQKLAQKFAQLLQQCQPNSLDETARAIEALGIKLEYLDYYNERLFAAAYIGHTRLIDNIAITTGEKSC